jgi:integrase
MRQNEKIREDPEWPREREDLEREDLELELRQARASIDTLLEQVTRKERTLGKLGVVTTPEGEPEAASAPNLGEIVSRWAKETEAPPQHVEQYRYVANRFAQLHGDLPITEITKAHIRAFKDAIGKLPNSTRADIREAKLHDAIRLGAAKGLPPITPRTVTKHVTGLATLLRYAEGAGFIETNPAAGIRFPKVKGKISDRERRKPFSREELATLFAAIDAAHGATEDDYWIPRIALYHGLRVEEVCQLSRDDVRQDGTTWVISVNDSGDKKVKNESSARTVPLHPTMIAEGFLKHRERSTGPRLFATLAPDGRGRLGGPYGKRFARILREKAKITDKSRTFHSLRHRFADACRNAGVPHEIMARLMGHTVGSRVSAGYGTGESVSVLASWLAKVQPL